MKNLPKYPKNKKITGEAKTSKKILEKVVAELKTSDPDEALAEDIIKKNVIKG